MPQVTITINDRPYAVACDPGQEARTRELGKIIDGRIAGFAKQFAQAGEARLLVLAALTLADELAEATESAARKPAPGANGVTPALTDGVDRLAARIEAVAARLEEPHL